MIPLKYETFSTKNKHRSSQNTPVLFNLNLTNANKPKKGLTQWTK